MKKSDLNVFNLNDKHDAYMVTINQSRTEDKGLPFDLMTETSGTTAHFTTYERALEYFYENQFRVDTLIEMMDDGWTDVMHFSCDIQFIGTSVDEVRMDYDEEILAEFSAEWEKEVN